MNEKLRQELHTLLTRSDNLSGYVDGISCWSLCDTTKWEDKIEQAFLSSPEWLKEHGYVKVEPAEGELAPLPTPSSLDGWTMRDKELVYEGMVAQLAHNKARYQELVDICNRLMQDNTELTEKMAIMVALPSEDEFVKILQGYIVDREKMNICDFMFPEQIVLVAKELLRKLKERKND